MLFSILPSYCPKVFGQNVQSIVLLLYYLYLSLIVLPHHKNGRLTLQRFLLLNSLMFLTRTTTVSVTSLPQPNFTHKCLVAQTATATFPESLKIVVGTKFPPKACGDLIYSGHASCALMAHWILLRTGCLTNNWSVRISGLSVVMAVVSIFLCRSHYTVDVVLAFYFSYFLVDFYFLRAEGVVDGGWIGGFIRYMEGGEEGLLRTSCVWGETGGWRNGKGFGGKSIDDDEEAGSEPTQSMDTDTDESSPIISYGSERGV